MEVRGQPSGVGSLLPLYGVREFELGKPLFPLSSLSMVHPIPRARPWPRVLSGSPAAARMPSPVLGSLGLGAAHLQAGGGERLHDPPHVQAELLDAATCPASREHERVRLRGVGLEVAELRLGASALLVPGLRGRQGRGEHPGPGRDPTGAPRPPAPPRLTRPDCPMLPASPRGRLGSRFRRTPLTSDAGGSMGADFTGCVTNFR